MNERIKQLAVEAGMIVGEPNGFDMTRLMPKEVKFAELIVAECKENFSKVWYEQGMDIRGAELGKLLTRFDEHFGVEE